MRMPAVATSLSLAGMIGVLVGGPTFSDEGVEVEPELPATTRDAQQQAATSPVLAVHPDEPEFVALANRIEAPAFGCALQVSGDAGRTFVPTEPVSDLPEESETCYAPDVTFGPDGTLYYLFTGLAGRGNRPVGAYLTSTPDRGRTFRMPRRVLEENRFGTRFAAGPDGRLHLVWVETGGREPGLAAMPPPPNPIMAAHSDDGGQSWSQPVRVSDTERERVVAPTVDVAGDGTVHVAYYDLRDDTRDYQGLEGPVWNGEWEVVVASSRDRGETFEPGVVAGEVTPAERVTLIFTMPPPALASNPEGGVFVGWHGARHGDVDAFAATATDAGRTWSSPVRLNDDEVGNGRDQWLPQLAVSPGGRLDAIFYDHRDDAQNIAAHVYYTSSHDRGATFSQNVRLTSEATNTRIGLRYGGSPAPERVEFGSQLGLLSRDDQAVAAWTDTRNAVQRRQQDVFVTRVAASEPAPWRAISALGLIAALAVVTAVGLGLGWRRHRGDNDCVAEGHENDACSGHVGHVGRAGGVRDG